MKLNELTVKEANEKLTKREITSLELTKACLARIKEIDNKIKACLTVCEKEALEAAREADRRRAKGEAGELLGIPCLIKDNILTKGIRTTAASKILENYVAPFDATVVKKLKEAGAVILGKTNLDEFAHGASTENSAFGPTHNPWDLNRVPGGSSGGSAAAVAADMCLFALGTDTGGSIRCPASFCGVVGLKPSYGRSSRFGLIAMTSSTDVPGPLAKTVEDAAIVMSVIAGQDKLDSTTAGEKVPGYSQKLDSIKGLKIGVPKEYFIKGMEKQVEEAVKAAIAKMEELGGEIIPVSLPHTKYAVPVYYIITPSEISSNLARFDGIKYGLSEKDAQNLAEIYFKSRGKGFGPEAKRRIMLGTYVLSAGYYDAYYLQAQKVRTRIIQEFDRVLSEVDILATPTSPDTAFKIGEKSNDPMQMYLEDIFVSGASLAGLPAISVPCGFINPIGYKENKMKCGDIEGNKLNEKQKSGAGGLPVGLQIIGRRFDEATIMRAAREFEQATEWHKRKPEL
ncbi:Asp-tRNA(Asn)/Glu-tRNA(Gln) amidotransferase subunit GatA [Patescibacteria group bacterium]|nr:Asp-tRNA(Asn)/Glu-tRNA(Gln) amidotransferase subunit GatA [Patescibacteria group bacterium]MBU4347142.1 Asp-tRNA(Asn)/Glu-tRNA(Gln) amidotransferase subunit GatA [Patescibacteria group bacterium]MBU4455627.1 Asp-tRNA(Asn)/Glu-tRNA(Gln) amidotransferase subunit GatA [Patescibacteria group bacterium]MCG2691049.1 Asp-tRNA(Asn)/Glu-tRNA(Gln) amidotransferase subunit GatA [Candidatus Parcubacteria bacterium]